VAVVAEEEEEEEEAHEGKRASKMQVRTKEFKQNRLK
jgi:hypothetical protein